MSWALAGQIRLLEHSYNYLNWSHPTFRWRMQFKDFDKLDADWVVDQYTDGQPLQIGLLSHRVVWALFIQRKIEPICHGQFAVRLTWPGVYLQNELDVVRIKLMLAEYVSDIQVLEDFQRRGGMVLKDAYALPHQG